MTREKTSELISACDSIFKQTGLLRLASVTSDAPTSMREGSGGISCNAALDKWKEQERAPEVTERGIARRLGNDALDALLPDRGLPTGKVIELSMRGGAALGTQIALWACRAAQRQAALAGAESWCAFLDPSATLHAPGVKTTGVDLQRLLVVRPSLQDMERVAVRLSEARVFSVIVIDLVGVPWAQATTAGRAEQTLQVQQGRPQVPSRTPRRSQNWSRTVRQLALKLANTQAQVVLLTDSDAHRQAPLPVALRLQLSSEVNGLELKVLKDTQGRVGQKGVIHWSEWWGSSVTGGASSLGSAMGRAKTLHHRRPSEIPVPQSSLNRPRQSEWPTAASSRLARTSRASL